MASKIRYLNFRPYIDSLDTINIIQRDYGYYYKFLGSEINLLKFTLIDNGFIEANANDWTVLFSSGSIKQNIYQNLRKYQKVNHFPRSFELTRKDLLYKNVSKFQVQNNIKTLNFIPNSYILPQDFSYLEEVTIFLIFKIRQWKRIQILYGLLNQ